MKLTFKPEGTENGVEVGPTTLWTDKAFQRYRKGVPHGTVDGIKDLGWMTVDEARTWAKTNGAVFVDDPAAPQSRVSVVSGFLQVGAERPLGLGSEMPVPVTLTASEALAVCRVLRAAERAPDVPPTPAEWDAARSAAEKIRGAVLHAPWRGKALEEGPRGVLLAALNSDPHKQGPHAEDANLKHFTREYALARLKWAKKSMKPEYAEAISEATAWVKANLKGKDE